MGSPTVVVRACIISFGQASGCVGWVAHRLLVSCSVLGVAVKPDLLTYDPRGLDLSLIHI